MMFKIGRNIVGKLRAARSYSSTTQVPAERLSPAAPFLAAFSVHAGMACVYWTDFCGVRTKLKARVASHDEYERKHEEFKTRESGMGAKKLASVRNVTLNDQSYLLENLTRMIVAGCLSIAAASISSAGGIGEGGLFTPILAIVAGLDLKAASSFSALMVTGGSVANVVSNVLAKKNTVPTASLINYDVALLSEPCMLLEASVGVFCNILFPEWLITLIFTIFLVWSTFKTFKFGITHWNLESQGINIRCHHKYLEEEEDGRLGITNDNIIIINPIITVESEGNLASREQQEELLLVYKVVQVVPWRKFGMLAIIWFSFFLLYLLRGGRYGQGRQGWQCAP